MKDLAIALDNRPGALAEMGDVLGQRESVSRAAGHLSLTARGLHISCFLMEIRLAMRLRRQGYES